MANFQIHELTSGTIDRDSNVIHDTLNGGNYETRKATAGAVADLNNIQIANEYDDTSTYDYGDYCIYEGVLYRNIVAITVAEAWTVAHWTSVMVTGEYKRVRIMTKAQFDLLTNDEKDGFIYVSDYPTKIQDIDNVNLTTSDNNKLLGVSVVGSDISVGAVDIGTTYALFTVSTISTTQTAYNTFNSRKFSDYKLIIFVVGSNNTNVRRTIVMTNSNFVSGYTINEAILLGSTSSSASDYGVSNIQIQYKDDTSFYALVSGNGLANHLTVYGIKF